MSDALIKGMVIPKNCEECDLSKTRRSSLGDIIDCKYIGTVGSAFKDPYNILNNRHPKCPLIEVPPHSDLVDRNKLLEKAHYDYNEATHDYNKFRVVFEDDIIDAPVVIEGNIDGSEVTE